MPYASTKELPEAVKKLPGAAKRIFRAAFNAAFKQYSGDETRAFRVAWSAVKKKFKKSGDQWVAKQDAQGDLDMKTMLAQVKEIYERYLAQAPQGDKENAQGAIGLLDQIAADPEKGIHQLRLLEETCVAPCDFELGQDYNYNLYRSGQVNSEHAHDFPGSVQHRIRMVCHAAHMDRNAKEYLGKYGFVLAVYPDAIVTCARDDYEDSEIEYYKIGYTFDESSYEVTFGEAEPVDVATVVVPKGAMGAGESDDVTEDAEGNDTDTDEQAGAKIDVSAGAYGKPGKKKKMKKQETEEEIPDWLAQGKDPPGGDQILTQSQSTLLQVVKHDEATGVMKVKGVATTGNVINANKQVYPTQVWEDNMPRLKRLMDQGKLLGECMHPADGRATLDRVCMKYTDLELDENELKFEADILPTPYGKLVQTLIQNGVRVDISSRGAGAFKKGEWEGVKDVDIVQRGFRADAFDGVISGASPGSTITDWQLQSASSTDDTEEEEPMKELLERLAASMETLAAKQDEQAKVIASLSQAKDEDVTKIEAVKTDDVKTDEAKKLEQAALTPDPETARREKVIAQMEKSLVSSRIESLVQEAKEAGKYFGPWLNAYRKHLRNVGAETLEQLEQANEKICALLQDVIADAPKFPGHGFVVQPNVGERGFQTGNELLQHLVSDLPDELPVTGLERFRQVDEKGNPVVPGWFQTPRRQCYRILENIARYQSEGWNGPAALKSLVMLSQGHSSELIADQVLNQACADGTTAVGAGGAPTSAIFIFPLIRRVFPQLIATELSSVQPMDRPNGKIFFLDAYRISTGVDSVDPAGATISNRMRIDRSDSFSDSYANDPGECEVANTIQLRLASVDVTVETKKLQAQWTIEEVQDLRAYHGLDASLELVGSLSREIASEWNQLVLKDLLNGATAGNRTFGTVAPSGYTQKEWDEYITRYLDAANTDIFKKRNGVATHIIAGPDAWLKLSATHRTGTIPNGLNPEMFPGLVLTPWMSVSMPGVKTFMTNFWTGVNTDKILVLRRGQDWSDTPHVWAPYLDYVSAPLTLPDTFTQKQGIMSRAAHRTVVGDAIATITISTGTTGATV